MSLANCLVKAGKAFNAEERAELLANHKRLIDQGVKDPDSAAVKLKIRTAVSTRQSVIDQSLEQKLSRKTAVTGDVKAVTDALAAHPTLGTSLSKAVSEGKLVVANASDEGLPSSIRRHLRESLSRGKLVLGAHDTRTGVSYVFADRVSENDRVGVALHEALHEAQTYAESNADGRMKMLFGEGGQQIVDRINLLAEHGDRQTKEKLAQARQKFFNAMGVGKGAQGSTRVRNFEMAAYTFQALNTPNPDEQTQSWLESTAKAVTKTLRKLFKVNTAANLDTMTLDDIQSLFEQAVDMRVSDGFKGVNPEGRDTGPTDEDDVVDSAVSELMANLPRHALQLNTAESETTGQTVLVNGLVSITLVRQVDKPDVDLDPDSADESVHWGHASYLREDTELWDVALHAYDTETRSFRDVGHGQFELLDGKVEAIHNIELNRADQGKGFGEMFVASIVATATDEGVRLIQAKDDAAKAFWDSMGVPFHDFYDNSNLDWSDYEAQRRKRNKRRSARGDVGLGVLQPKVAEAGEGSRNTNVGRDRGDSQTDIEDGGDRLRSNPEDDVEGVDDALSELENELGDYNEDDGVVFESNTSPTPPPANKPSPKGRQLGQFIDAPIVPKSKLTSSFIDSLRFRLGFLSREQIKEVAPKSLTAIQDFVREAEQMDALRNEHLSEDGKLLDKWHRAAQKDPKGNDQMQNLMHDTTVLGYNPSTKYQPLITGTEYAKQKAELLRLIRGAKTPKAEAGYQGKLDHLETRWREEAARKRGQPDIDGRWASLPQNFKDLYREIESRYYTNRMDLFSVLKQRVEESDASEEARAAMKDKLRLAFEDGRVQRPYFPLSRFGEYFMTVLDPVDGSLVEWTLHESSASAERAAKEAQDKGYKVDWGLRSAAKHEWKHVDPAFASQVTTMIGTAKNGASKAERTDLAQQVWQLYLQSLPEMSVRKQFIRRKKTKGWSQDAMRAFSKISLHNAHHMARLTHAEAMQQHVQRVREQAEALSGREQTEAQAYADEVQGFHEWAMEPTSDPRAQFLTTLGFFSYLGVSPAAAAINMFQTATVTLPYLAARHGVRAASEMLKASKEFAGIAGENLVGRVKNKQLFLDPDQKTHWSDRLKGNEKAAFEELVKRGIIDKTLAHDLAGVADEGFTMGGSSVTAKVIENMKFRRLINHSAALFHNAEVFNREVSAMAAYRLEFAKLRKEGKAESEAFRLATDYAHKVVKDTHFDYSNANRSRYMRSPAAKVVLQFKQYALNMTFRIVRDAMLSFRKVSPDLSPELRKEARLRVAGMTGMAMATSGLTGFFGWTALTAMVNAIAHATGEEDEWDLKAATHQALRDAYGEGVADTIVNGPMPSVGKRVAPDVVRMWIPDSDIDMEERGWGANALQQLMGPVVGGLIFGSVPEAVTLAAKGEEYRAAERASPKFLRDILKAIRYHEEGVRSLVGERDLVHDTSAMEEIMQAMGVSPFEVQKKYERNSRFYGDLEAIRRDKQKLLIQVKDRMREGEAVPSGVQEDIDKFNRKVSKLGLSDMVINNRTIRESIKSSKRRSKDMIDGAYVPDNQREFYEKNYR